MKAGTKFDYQKPRMDLVPSSSIHAEAEVLTYGTEKYDDRNWEEGMRWGRVYAATVRHLLAFWAGEDLDEESGLPHLAHAKTNIAFLIEYMETHPELDDRPKRRKE